MNETDFVRVWMAWDAAPRDARKVEAFSEACNVVAKQLEVDVSKLRDLLSALRRYGLDYGRCVRTVRFVHSLANR